MEYVLFFAVAGIILWYIYDGYRGEMAGVATARRVISRMPETFVIVDLETTGLKPTEHEIIEIGAVKIDTAASSHPTIQALVKPREPIPKIITEITGITQEMVDADGEPPAQALRSLRDFIGTSHVIAYNAEFDISFLKVAGKRHGIEFDVPYICALKLARRAWPRRRGGYKLAQLAESLGHNGGGAHRAMADCKMTLHVYMAAMMKIEERRG